LDEIPPNLSPAAGGNEPADAELVRGALDGRREDFDVLVTRYQRQAVAVSFRLVGSTHDALEIAQDAFLKAFGSLHTLQKPEAFGGWLMRIVSNLSLNFRRSRKLRRAGSIDESDGAGDVPDSGSPTDPARVMAGMELGERLQQALQQLPEKQRMAILLFTVEQMPQKQVAEALNCSVEAVKWHVFQGRKRLRELLRDCF
jgi:RNA polymerase sigma-70 factor (ECF subfamily)